LADKGRSEAEARKNKAEARQQQGRSKAKASPTQILGIDMNKKLLFFVFLTQISALSYGQTESAKKEEIIKALSRNLAVSSTAPNKTEPPKVEPAKVGAVKPESGTVPPDKSDLTKVESNWKPSWEPSYQSKPGSIDLAIQFEFNSNKIMPDSMKLLEDLASALNSKELLTRRFVIEGHTDGVGASNYNLKLSQLRADQVKTVLVRKMVKADRLQSIGKGFSEPANAQDIKSAENRRVRIVSLEK
jgi:outer membrane protein OmpA-like peptidoglycan-associated protein